MRSPSSTVTPSSRAEDLQNRLIEFGTRSCLLLRGEMRELAQSHIANQLVRSATAPAAHYAEARHAESRRDFMHKMHLGVKELRETQVWLRIAIPLTRRGPQSEALLQECSELIAIFVASVKTARNRLNDGRGNG